MTSTLPPFPPSGKYVAAVRDSARTCRQQSNITISSEAVERFLSSPSFAGTFNRLRTSHGLTMPLNFPSIHAELNLLSILSLLNFASGYRVPLHKATGRGAFDNIRALVFGMYLSSSTGAGDLLSAQGMKGISQATVADLMGVTGSLHVERPHETIPGITVGELGGPLLDVVQLVTKALNETGTVLVQSGYQDLGAFVLEALNAGDKARKNQPDNEDAPECEVILERLVRAIPAFQDMALVNGQPVYCFKKALLTIHAIALRFGSNSSSGSPSIPIPRTHNLPIFSDNVIPSMLVHLGVIDLSTSTPSLGLSQIFPDAQKPDVLQALLDADPAPTEKSTRLKEPPEEGPELTVEQAFVLRAAAIDACELIVQKAHELGAKGGDRAWLKDVTLPELDAWVWAVAKDRMDYRKLARFALKGTTYF